MSLLTGTKLKPYEITALLGAGRMGEVYLARYGLRSRCRFENPSQLLRIATVARRLLKP